MSLGVERFQNPACSSEDVFHDVLWGLESAPNKRASRLHITFRLPNVPLFHTVPGKARSSDRVVDAGRLVHIDVVRMILDANREVVQVWGGTYKGDRAVEALYVWPVRTYFQRSPPGGDRAHVRYRFVLHFEATKALETGVEHCRNMHVFCCRGFDHNVST